VRHTLKAGETFNAGDFVELDANEDILEVSGADPTPLYGLAAENATDVVEAGYVMVYPFIDGVNQMAMQGDNAPTADDVGQKYGIIEDGDGIYTVDGTDTTNVRVYVHDVDINRELYFCTVLESHRFIPLS
jgi:hypothetical protein